MPFVALERAGVVHQHADRAERRCGLRQQCLGLCFIGEVGLQQRGAAARAADGIAGGHARVAVGMAVHCHVKPGLGQRERDGTADALCRPGDQGGARYACGDVSGPDHGGNNGSRAEA